MKAGKRKYSLICEGKVPITIDCLKKMVKGPLLQAGT